MSVRCRACIKCREYIVIHPSSPINQVEIKRFEKVHSGHTIMTTDINEVKGAYSSFKNHTNKKAAQEAE